MTTQSQSPVVVKFNMFYNSICSLNGLSFGSNDCTKELKTIEWSSFWVGLANFGQKGLISDPKISSKLRNGINDPNGIENEIYTMMKGMETFYGDHTVPIISCSEVQYVL